VQGSCALSTRRLPPRSTSSRPYRFWRHVAAAVEVVLAGFFSRCREMHRRAEEQFSALRYFQPGTHGSPFRLAVSALLRAGYRLSRPLAGRRGRSR